MVLGIGTDLVEVARIARELELRGPLEGVFTPAELAYCTSMHNPAQHFAARFAAKEALVKALAAAQQSGLFWIEIEVQRGPNGEPSLVLSGRIKAIADRLGVKRIHVSLSHTGELAFASVIVES
jgi:holo-[acyl-carrier protein] synthase